MWKLILRLCLVVHCAVLMTYIALIIHLQEPLFLLLVGTSIFWILFCWWMLDGVEQHRPLKESPPTIETREQGGR